MLETLSHWSAQRSSWCLLAFSAFCLLSTALYFQHQMQLAPCIMCIYQRTAVIGLFIFALLPIIYNVPMLRALAYIGTLTSSIWGFFLAREHVDIIFASNPFFAICEIVPNFPTWLPLHESIPSVFAAQGSCNENSWQFLSMGMAEWMQIIFSIYTIIIAGVLINRLVIRKAV